MRRGRSLGVAHDRCKKGNVLDALKRALNGLDRFLDGYGPFLTLSVFAGSFVLGRSLVGFATMLSMMLTVLTWWPRRRAR